MKVNTGQATTPRLQTTP